MSLTVWLVSLFTLASPIETKTQQTAWGQDIVVLKSADVGAYNTAASSFQNIMTPEFELLEYDLQGDLAQGRKLGRKIRASPARLVVAIGLKAALAAKLEILDIPIISCMVLAPAKYDLTSDNMTSIGLRIPIQRQFDMIQQLIPAVKRVGVLFDPTKTGQTIQRANDLAKKHDLEIVSSPVSSPQDVSDRLRALLPDIDVLWLIPDSTVLTEDSLEFLLSTTLEARIPVVGFSSGLVRSGAFAGLYINYAKVGTQVAKLAKDILKGNRISQGISLTPEHVSLAINKQIAEYLGLAVPQHLLKEAEEVY